MNITSLHGTSVRHLVRPVLIAGVLVAAGSGCVLYEGEPTPACDQVAKAGLMISVVDAETDELLPATIEVTDGAYREELGPAQPPGDRYAAAFERPGVYEIQVSSEGYFPETVGGVVVEAGACHVVTEEVVVKLISEQAAGCTGEAVPALVITVIDAASGLSIDATVKVFDDTYLEEQSEPAVTDEYWFAYERAGVYDIEVSSDGYESVTIENVAVSEDVCHVITEKIEVALERA